MTKGGEDMETGRELDAEVAEKVMGWYQRVLASPHPRSQKNWYRPGSRHPVVLPGFSTDIAAAWLVVNHLYHSGLWDITIRISPVSRRWVCSLDAPNRTVSIGSSDNTAPLAICHAALKTARVGGGSEQWI